MFDESTLKFVLEKMEVCRKGHCYECPYSIRNKQCTDSLIDDCYFLLEEMLENEDEK